MPSVCLCIPSIVALFYMGLMVGLHSDSTKVINTACLLVVLSQFYSPGLILLSLLALDAASHWFQMYRFCILYSSFLDGNILAMCLSLNLMVFIFCAAQYNLL